MITGFPGEETKFSVSVSLACCFSPLIVAVGVTPGKPVEGAAGFPDTTGGSDAVGEVGGADVGFGGPIGTGETTGETVGCVVGSAVVVGNTAGVGAIVGDTVGKTVGFVVGITVGVGSTVVVGVEIGVDGTVAVGVEVGVDGTVAVGATVGVGCTVGVEAAVGVNSTVGFGLSSGAGGACSSAPPSEETVPAYDHAEVDDRFKCKAGRTALSLLLTRSPSL